MDSIHGLFLYFAVVSSPSLSSCFSINLTKLPVYVAVGLVRNDVLVFDAVLIGLIPLGSYLGKWMHDRIPEQIFNRVIMIFVLLAGIQLITNVNLVHRTLDTIVRPWIGPI